MITRVWRGWTATADDADAYERLLGEEILPSFVGIDGFAGAVEEFVTSRRSLLT